MQAYVVAFVLLPFIVLGFVCHAVAAGFQGGWRLYVKFHGVL